MTKTVCEKCKGRGQRAYDDRHISPCKTCCAHSDGWWKLEKHYGSDNGKYACKHGCGVIVETPLDDKEHLLGLTRDALADVLGREPTQQEILRAHAGFKRMAFHLYDHVRCSEKQSDN